MQRLIIVKNPIFLSTKFVVKDSKQLEKLKQLIDNLSILDDLIVFVANYEKIDKRKAIVKLLIKNVNVVETNFKAQEVAKILKSIAAAEKIKFIGDAFTELIKRSDNVFSLALNNYLKLKNIVEGKEILPEVVKSNIDQSLSENVFEIMTAIFNKNYVEANRRLDDQINNGLTPIALLAIFESQLEFLLCVKILQKRGWVKDQIVDELDANPYRIYYALNNRLDITRLKQSIKYAIKLDYGYKNGTYTGESFLKVYLLNI
ncbi:putative DNA polymerase III, delta subunit [Lactobacillus iners LactinV 11V1-d]|nr:putative DNA polymerase III, delta subunit [Lactobacillus iners LactinV 11V1-d]